MLRIGLKSIAYIRGGEPAARVNIWYGPHPYFHCPS